MNQSKYALFFPFPFFKERKRRWAGEWAFSLVSCLSPGENIVKSSLFVWIIYVKCSNESLLLQKKGFSFVLCHEKILSKWDMVYEIVAVIFNAAVMLIDFFPHTYNILVTYNSPWQMGLLLYHSDCLSWTLWLRTSICGVFYVMKSCMSLLVE